MRASFCSSVALGLLLILIQGGNPVLRLALPFSILKMLFTYCILGGSLVLSCIRVSLPFFVFFQTSRTLSWD